MEYKSTPTPRVQQLFQILERHHERKFYASDWEFDRIKLEEISNFLDKSLSETEACLIADECNDFLQDTYDDNIGESIYQELLLELLHCLYKISLIHSVGELASIIARIAPLAYNKEYDFAYYILYITVNLIKKNNTQDLELEPLFNFSMHHIMKPNKIPRTCYIDYVINYISFTSFHEKNLLMQIINVCIINLEAIDEVPTYYINYALSVCRTLIDICSNTIDGKIYEVIDACLLKLNDGGKEYIENSKFIDFIVMCFGIDSLSINEATNDLLVMFIQNGIMEKAEGILDVTKFILLNNENDEIKSTILSTLVECINQNYENQDMFFKHTLMFTLTYGYDYLMTIYNDARDVMKLISEIVDIIECSTNEMILEFARSFINIQKNLETIDIDTVECILDTLDSMTDPQFSQDADTICRSLTSLLPNESDNND